MRNLLAYSTEIPEDLMGKLLYGLGVTAIGIIIVFAVLVLIMLVIYVFQLVFGRNNAKSAVEKTVAEAPKKADPAPVSSAVAFDEKTVAAIAAATAMAQEELVVVLAAAVAAYEGCDPASSRYRIRSFRRIL